MNTSFIICGGKYSIDIVGGYATATRRLDGVVYDPLCVFGPNTPTDGWRDLSITSDKLRFELPNRDVFKFVIRHRTMMPVCNGISYRVSIASDLIWIHTANLHYFAKYNRKIADELISEFTNDHAHIVNSAGFIYIMGHSDVIFMLDRGTFVINDRSYRVNMGSIALQDGCRDEMVFKNTPEISALLATSDMLRPHSGEMYKINATSAAFITTDGTIETYKV